MLERVLARQPTHIGANHYYIHAVEASPHPEKALASAKRLETLAPSAGHLVHMPAHTYIRTGNYLDAARVNRDAARADERLAKATSAPFYLIGYYGHNLHFLAISNAFAGNSRAAPSPRPTSSTTSRRRASRKCLSSTRSCSRRR